MFSTAYSALGYMQIVDTSRPIGSPYTLLLTRSTWCYQPARGAQPVAACVCRFEMCQSDLPDRQAWPCCACVLLLLCIARGVTGSMQLHASAVQASLDVELGAVAPKTDCTLCLLLMEVDSSSCR